MANAFITLESGQDFVTRWTGYDMILEIAARELELCNEVDFAGWLRSRIPNAAEHKGDVAFENSKGELIFRTLDLRGLTTRNRKIFWEALRNGAEKLKQDGKAYSNLNPERITELMAMHADAGDLFIIESQTDNEIIVNGNRIAKVGPGW